VLQAWKEDAEEDRQVRTTMPDSQVPEFNRHIALMNGANQRLGPFVILLYALVEKLGLRYGWLLTLQLWDMQDLQVALALAEGGEAAKGKNARQEAQAEQALLARLMEAFKDSPVTEDLAADTVYWLPASFFVRFLGVWEMAVGLGLLLPVALRVTLLLFWAQMAGTFLVLVIHSGLSFQSSNPLLLTMTGEFVIKNLVLITAGLVIGSTVRNRPASPSTRSSRAA